MDAGMSDLLRLALYQAKYQIRNISNLKEEKEKYDVVGSICESVDVFIKNYEMNKAKKGDFLLFYLLDFMEKVLLLYIMLEK